MTMGRLSQHSIGLVAIALLGGAAALDDTPVAPTSAPPTVGGAFSTLKVKSCKDKHCEEGCTTQTVPQDMCLPFKTGSVIAVCSGSTVNMRFFNDDSCKVANGTHSLPVDKCTIQEDASVIMSCNGSESADATTNKASGNEFRSALEDAAAQLASSDPVFNAISNAMAQIMDTAKAANITLPTTLSLSSVLQFLSDVATAPPAQPTQP